ncbi:flavin reductase family protein [Streptomyces bottropensis]|uniref:flavin reductase family protein n=1 Tax=Streptomyces bottropensis TaxID=42235 RepID=UPI0036A2AC1D
MAAAAVRYLRAGPADGSGRATHPEPVLEALPRPELRCVGENERAPVDQAEFRRVLGAFATGVTVITAPPPPPPPGADASALTEPPAGFACQSFSSLSLDPPLVAFMVGRTSTTWPRIARARGLCVFVLWAAHREVWRRGAGGGGGPCARGAHTPPPPPPSPRITGAAAWIDCTVHAVHTGGDHLIVVGRVRALDTADDTMPLLFHRGRFGRLTT